MAVISNCETTAATPNTQFFAESEDYQYLVWDLPAGQINPGIGSVGSPLSNATSIQFTEQGIADWEAGFHGTFALDVYAVGCDGPSSEIQRETITILPEAVAPDAIALLDQVHFQTVLQGQVILLHLLFKMG